MKNIFDDYFFNEPVKVIRQIKFNFKFPVPVIRLACLMLFLMK